MIPAKSTVALASLLPLLAHAQRGGGDSRDLELDHDIAPACQSICRPVRQLAQVCDVDDDFVRDRLTAEYLGLQCYCLNTSFDVRGITALCASCIQQNPIFDDDDGRPEDDDIRGMFLLFLFFFFLKKKIPPALITSVRWEMGGKDIQN